MRTPSIVHHPRQQVPRPPQVAREHRVADGGELVQQLLEPQLVDLVDGDEQQLVVRRRVGLEVLLVEQVVDPQVGPVGEPGALLAEVAIGTGAVLDAGG